MFFDKSRQHQQQIASNCMPQIRLDTCYTYMTWIIYLICAEMRANLCFVSRIVVYISVVQRDVATTFLLSQEKKEKSLFLASFSLKNRWEEHFLYRMKKNSHVEYSDDDGKDIGETTKAYAMSLAIFRSFFSIPLSPLSLVV